MGKLDGYSPEDRERIVSVMCQLVDGRVESGEIPDTEEAIKAAMPQAFADAKATVNAANEFLSG